MGWWNAGCSPAPCILRFFCFGRLLGSQQVNHNPYLLLGLFGRAHPVDAGLESGPVTHLQKLAQLVVLAPWHKTQLVLPVIYRHGVGVERIIRFAPQRQRGSYFQLVKHGGTLPVAESCQPKMGIMSSFFHDFGFLGGFLLQRWGAGYAKFAHRVCFSLSWYPATGTIGRGTGVIANSGSASCNWSHHVNDFMGIDMNYTTYQVSTENTDSRAAGFPLRCIQE